MDTQDLSRSRALNNIPTRKLQEALAAINSSADDLQTKNIKLIAINRYAESNIPIGYWSLKMDRDFKGDPRLLDKYNEYILDLKSSYMNGTSICFAGNHGLGKTMTATCILKKASQKGYSCLYTTLSDIVTTLTSASGEDKFLARRELSLVDFLVIDEADIRFFNQSDNSKDLYGRSLEGIVRTRLHNKLPIIMATNSPNLKDNFISLFQQSLDSLLSRIEMFSVMPGPDFRKNNE